MWYLTVSIYWWQNLAISAGFNHLFYYFLIIISYLVLAMVLLARTIFLNWFWSLFSYVCPFCNNIIWNAFYKFFISWSDDRDGSCLDLSNVFYNHPGSWQRESIYNYSFWRFGSLGLRITYIAFRVRLGEGISVTAFATPNIFREHKTLDPLHKFVLLESGVWGNVTSWSQ